MAEGGSLAPGEELPVEVADWAFAKAFGWSCPTIDSAPAVRSDRMIEIDGVIEAAKAKGR